MSHSVARPAGVCVRVCVQQIKLFISTVNITTTKTNAVHAHVCTCTYVHTYVCVFVCVNKYMPYVKAISVQSAERRSGSAASSCCRPVRQLLALFLACALFQCAIHTCMPVLICVCVCNCFVREFCVCYGREGAGRCSAAAAANMHNRHIFYTARVLFVPLIFTLLIQTQPRTHTVTVASKRTQKEKNASTRKLHAVRGVRSHTHTHTYGCCYCALPCPYIFTLSRVLFALLAGTRCVLAVYQRWRCRLPFIISCLAVPCASSRRSRSRSSKQQTTSVPVASVITNYYYFFLLPPPTSPAPIPVRPPTLPIPQQLKQRSRFKKEKKTTKLI